MARTTRATQFLDRAGIFFTVHSYDYDPTADRIGIQAAEALGESPERVLKTLMVLVDGKPACIVLPSDSEAAMKQVAAALGGKQAEMMPSAGAERISGYKVGGISPFGQMRRVPVAIEENVLEHELVYINGGQRGLQVRLNPNDALKALAASAAAIMAARTRG